MSTLQLESAINTDSALPTGTGYSSARSRRVGSTVTSFVAFGFLAATTAGAAAVSPDQVIVGHDVSTSERGSLNLVVISRGYQSTGSAAQLHELREHSGLTWDQLARLFGVSRRSVHHWASGDNMNAAHQEALSFAVQFVSNMAGQTPSERKHQLLRAGPGGSAYEELRQSLASGVEALNERPIRLTSALGVVEE